MLRMKSISALRSASAFKRRLVLAGNAKPTASVRATSSATQPRPTGSVFARAEKFQFDSAIVRSVSPRIGEGLKLEPNREPVDYAKAVDQHHHYVQTLRKIGLNVYILPAENNLPDCIFPEDTAVVIGNIALITQPGHWSRRAETRATKDLLSKLGHNITEMAEQSAEATLDGGDVLFTGKEIFVGLSERTNVSGFEVLAKTFPMYHVTPIEIVDGLHLKSPLGLAGLGRITYSSDDHCARHSIQQMKEKAKYRYEYVGCPGPFESGNPVYVSSSITQETILYPGPETSPDGAKVFESLKDHTLIPMQMTEVAKIDGSLTCCSVLLVT